MKRYFIYGVILSFGFIYGISFSEENSKKFNSQRATKLYMDHCSNCHRKNGKGVRKVYPPLKNADYIKNASSENLLRGMLYGRSGEIKVNGKIYNGEMITEVDKSLSNSDIALILTYVYQKFNKIEKFITEKDVVVAKKLGKLEKH